jgi:di/tricarboxylate transporter
MPWRAPIATAGLLATLALALLNGDLRVSPAAWTARLLIALAQVGLLAAFFQRTGLLRPTGLALRSPIAHSTRSVGLALACLVALLSLIGVRAASLVGHGATP